MSERDQLPWWDNIEPQTPQEWALLRELHIMRRAALSGIPLAYVGADLDSVPVIQTPVAVSQIALPLAARVSVGDAPHGVHEFNARAFGVTRDSGERCDLVWSYYASKEIMRASEASHVLYHMLERVRRDFGAILAGDGDQ